MKQVSDPEAPVSTYQVDAEAKRVVQRGVPPVLSPFDENALEAALRIKDNQEGQITAVSLGCGLSKALALKALGAGADRMFFLDDGVFKDLDGYTTSLVLTAAIRKIGEYDLIFTGRQAADTNAGIVGSGIAGNLSIPSVTLANKVDLDNGKVRIERVLIDGYEVIEAPLPVLITVSNELGELRSVNVRDLMAAKNKPLTTWNTDDLDIQLPRTSRTRLVNLFMPQRDVSCEWIKGEAEEKLGESLALKLKEDGVI